MDDPNPAADLLGLDPGAFAGLVAEGRFARKAFPGAGVRYRMADLKAYRKGAKAAAKAEAGRVEPWSYLDDGAWGKSPG